MNEEESELCTACGKRPPAGYVARYGIYLPHLCIKCYIRHPEDSPGAQKNNRSIGSRKGMAP